MLKTLSQALTHPVATAEVCPKTSEWAQTALQFSPSIKQAEVLDAANRYIILCCTRQWGKSTVIAIKALHLALHKPNQSIVILSRTRGQAAILIRYAARYLARLGGQAQARRVLGYPFSLRLPNGGEIIAVAHNGDTSVGHTATVLIVDEAALVKDDVYWNISGAVSRTQGAIWLLSTPRRQAGFFFNIWHNGDARWRRILSPVTDCPGIDPGYLAMQQVADPIRYRQDFLCEFIQPPDRLIDIDTINRMVQKDGNQWCFQPLIAAYASAPPPPEF